MKTLANIGEGTAKRKKSRRVGRGLGSGVGKTAGRGEKGQGSRSGNNSRLGNEGGNLRLFQKLPTRGFSRARFQQKLDVINLFHVEKLFNDGELVSLETLIEKGFLHHKSYGVKVLGQGTLTKKVRFEVQHLSKSAREALEKAGIEYTVVE